MRDSNRPVCNFNSATLIKPAITCAKSPNIVNCVIKPVVQAASSSCVLQVQAHNIVTDPYYQNMPKDNLTDAIAYAGALGNQSPDY